MLQEGVGRDDLVVCHRFEIPVIGDHAGVFYEVCGVVYGGREK